MKRGNLIFSKRFEAGKRRTYFFDIKKTRRGDKFIVLTESKKQKYGPAFQKTRIHIYKEDITRFSRYLGEVVDEMKNLMPEYDFDRFARRAEQREARRLEGENSVPGEMDPSAHDGLDGAIEEDDLSW